MVKLRIVSFAALLLLISGRSLSAQSVPLKYLADPTFSALSRKGAPKDISQSGGKRGGCAITSNTERGLKAIVPPAEFGGLSATTEPTFWVYMPYSSDTPIAGILSIRSTESFRSLPSQKVPVTLPSQPGLVKLKLPNSIAPNQMLAWTLTVTCDENNPSRNPFIGGMVMVKQNSELSQRVASLTPSARLVEFARSGYWYDAIELLAELEGEKAVWQLMESLQDNAKARN